MNSFELITKYLPSAVDKYFAEDSKTAILENGNKFVDVNFAETGYVKIASILMDGLSDYYQSQTNSVDFLAPSTERPADGANYASYAGNMGVGQRDGFALGGTSVKWEIFRLQYVRGKQFRIDYIANEETAGVIIGNAVEEFNRLKVIPEVDACRFGLIADTASLSLGNLASENIEANQIIAKFNAGFEWLAEREVPEEQQVIFVSPSVNTLIRNTTEINKFVTQGEYRSNAGIDFTVEKYMGRPIIEVPSNRFFTKVLLTDNGYRHQTDSKIINYMIVSTKAVVPIRKLEWSKIYGPEQAGIAGFHGYIINYLLYHGVVIPDNKITGVYVSVSNNDASTKVNTLNVATAKGNAVNTWKLKNYFTNPAGLRGYVVYSYNNEFTLGSAISSVGAVNDAYFVAEKGVVNKNDGNATDAYFGLVDANGTIIATSGGTKVKLEND